jgi:hypothetical protein
MKHEIIYTEDYALIVSDEQAKNNDWGYIPFQGGEVKLVGKYFADDWRKVIAHRPLTDALILKGVPLLPEFEDDDFLNTEIQVVGDNKTMSVSNFLKKYGKETYKYTEEDILDAWELGASEGLPLTREKKDKLIKSLQQPKRPKFFECKMEPKYKHIGAVKGIYGSGFRKQNLMHGLPKTITNSQG